MDDSIESPSFRLLYQTIDEKLRFGVQSVMDSAVKEAGAFLAGLILAGIGVLEICKAHSFFLDSYNYTGCLAATLLSGSTPNTENQSEEDLKH